MGVGRTYRALLLYPRKIIIKILVDEPAAFEPKNHGFEVILQQNTAADAAAANKQKQNIGSNIGQQCIGGCKNGCGRERWEGAA